MTSLRSSGVGNRKRRHALVLATICIASLGGCSDTPEGKPPSDGAAGADNTEIAAEPSTIESVTLHPPVAALFTCSEHAAGTLKFLGDALGADCVVQRFDGRWTRSYDGDGSRNEDWFGWDEPLLAPFDGTVVRVVTNDVTNDPGVLGESPAASIRFRRNDGVHVTYAHVRAVSVAEGEEVDAGTVVARIGNNGMSRHPHVHVGAWKDDTPYQVRFDLEAMSRIRGG